MIFDIERFLSYGQESSAVKDSAVFIKFENKEQRLEFKRQLEIYDPVLTRSCWIVPTCRIWTYCLSII